MSAYGGVVPEIASREHLKALPLALEKALSDARLSLEAIDHFVATNRPGLIGALLVGVNFTKTLAYCSKKPFSTVNHIDGHIYSPLLGENPPAFPWIALVASGGHSEIYYVKNEVENEWLGGTLDDAAGEAFDKIGKVLGFGYPAGPKIDKLVAEHMSAELLKAYRFPIAQTGPHTFSFSGLKTAVALQASAISPMTDEKRLAISACAQEAIVDALVKKLEQSAAMKNVSQIVVTGGVACNSRLRTKLPQAYFPKPKHCSDNAAMIAVVAYYHLISKTPPQKAWQKEKVQLNLSL
jgi:N6-L-threonylcarbamoyladenine synthase